MKDLQLKARNLRNNQTQQERKLWSLIKNRQFYGYRFLRQYAIPPYIVDFICREKQVIIEIDGGQHNDAAALEYDRIRTEYLNSQGFKVVRFWNNDIDGNIEGVYLELEKIFGVGLEK